MKLSPNWRWAAFAALLLAAFIFRGIMLACVLPPFEMWDEYQHLAYIDYVHETGHLPILNETKVPLGFLQAVVHWPLPLKGMQELHRAQRRGYANYWTSSGPPRPFTGAQPTIYEAQHPPVYYWLMGGIYHAAGGEQNLLAAVGALRITNVVIAAVGLAVFLGWLGRVCINPAHAMIIGLWVTLHPLFLLNATRVANDSLAVTLGIIVVVWSMRLTQRRLLWHSAGIALALGIGILTKSTDIALIPFTGCCLLRLAAQKQIPWRQFLLSAFIGLAILAAETAPYFHFTLVHYGILIPMQEAVVNHQKGLRIADYAHWLTQHDLAYWESVASQLFLKWGLWVGGWSFLDPPSLYLGVFPYLLAVSAVGWPIAWLFRRETWKTSRLFIDGSITAMSALLCLLIVAGLGYHVLQSALAWGGATTLPWYAAVAFPWFWLLIAASAIAWRHGKPGYWVAMGMPVLFFVTELNSTWGTMIVLYSQKPLSVSALKRLASLHPHALGMATLIVSTGAAVILVGAAVFLCVQSLRDKLTPAV